VSRTEVPRKRALGERAAKRCEDATTPRCACRCNGAFHGAKRIGAGETVWELPQHDPHWPGPPPRPPANPDGVLPGQLVLNGVRS
jgi:hypothetical protein